MCMSMSVRRAHALDRPYITHRMRYPPTCSRYTLQCMAWGRLPRGHQCTLSSYLASVCADHYRALRLNVPLQCELYGIPHSRVLISHTHARLHVSPLVCLPHTCMHIQSFSGERYTTSQADARAYKLALAVTQVMASYSLASPTQAWCADMPNILAGVCICIIARGARREAV